MSACDLRRFAHGDGIKTTREWAKATAVAYRLYISDSNHYASQPDWRPLFEKSFRELKMFADTGILDS